MENTIKPVFEEGTRIIRITCAIPIVLPQPACQLAAPPTPHDLYPQLHACTFVVLCTLLSKAVLPQNFNLSVFVPRNFQSLALLSIIFVYEPIYI